MDGYKQKNAYIGTQGNTPLSLWLIKTCFCVLNKMKPCMLELKLTHMEYLTDKLRGSSGISTKHCHIMMAGLRLSVTVASRPQIPWSDN